jgi:hypothetical protein
VTGDANVCDFTASSAIVRSDATTPTSSVDRVCEACDTGKFATEGSLDCQVHSSCGATTAATCVEASGTSVVDDAAACAAVTALADNTACAAVSTVAGATGACTYTASSATARLTTTTGTTIADTVCADCASDRYALAPWNDCAAHSTPSCGQTAAGTGVRSTVSGTTTADAKCADCAATHYALTNEANCAAKLANAADCTVNVECDSGHCHDDGKCADAPTAPGPT